MVKSQSPRVAPSFWALVVGIWSLLGVWFLGFDFMIRVVLPHHLRTLARVGDEVHVDLNGSVTVKSILDALEANYPMLRGTIREHATLKRRPMVRFFACGEDVSLAPPELALPNEVAAGKEPLFIVGAIAGG
jgi:sulfur-carrier protein